METRKYCEVELGPYWDFDFYRDHQHHHRKAPKAPSVLKVLLTRPKAMDAVADESAACKLG